MMKKLLILLITCFIAVFTQTAKADEVFKVTSANFDTSNSLIVLTSPDFSQNKILPSIKLVKLENPLRAYFDIDDAILTVPKQDWTFNSGLIKQVKINQFSTNPNKVRVVLYGEDGFDFSKIQFLRLKNNIIIKLRENKWDEDYFINTYRDERSSSGDFYEYLTVSVPVKETPKTEKITDQINKAFNVSPPQNTPETPAVIKKNLKLNTKYYLNKITPKANALLLNGYGAITIEKPMILQNPSRIVYDLPNSLTDMAIRNTEYKLNSDDTAKLGQFQVNKSRIVITTTNVEKYIPVYSSDSQSLIIANYEKINPRTLISNVSDVVGYHYEKTDNQTSSMVLAFSHPIIHGIDRQNNNLTIYLYNVQKYSEDAFRSKFNGTPFGDAKITLMPQIGMKLTVPLPDECILNTYLGTDGRTLKIKVKSLKKDLPIISTAHPKKQSDKYIVVIDPGHGGSDYGAIRGNINEKDIVLDISKRVENLLKKQGYSVVMTRNKDDYVSLQDRVSISENINPDIFVSIHVNSSTKPEITGVETHYYRQESLTLAQIIHASLASRINYSPNRGLFKSKFYVINHTTAPAILCEIGFISNDNERGQLVSDKRKNDTAKAIVEGINDYFKHNK